MRRDGLEPAIAPGIGIDDLAMGRQVDDQTATARLQRDPGPVPQELARGRLDREDADLRDLALFDFQAIEIPAERIPAARSGGSLSDG